MQQLMSLSMKLQLADSGKERFPQVCPWGPFLQGVLMEAIDSDYASTLHASPFNPYSQYCRGGDVEGELLWTVSTLTNEAADQIIAPLMKLEEVKLHRAGKTFAVVQRRLASQPVDVLSKGIFEEGSSRMKIDFLTPTAFKSQGDYVFMPTVRHICQSLLMRYSYLYNGSGEIDEETLSYIDAHTKIVSYRLNSHYFAHAAGGGKKIPAFMGSVTFGLGGGSAAAGLVRMLAEFGEFSGMGIKTSMGMGAMSATPLPRQSA